MELFFSLVPGLPRKESQVHRLESCCSSMLQVCPESEPLRREGLLYMQLCLHAVLIALLEFWLFGIALDSFNGVSSFSGAIYGSCLMCGSTCTPENS